MTYEKIIKDTEGDTARVVTQGADRNVDFWTQQATGDQRVYLNLPPKAARALAKALREAANVAEGKPNKAPKPETVDDGDGDTWYLHANGKYSLYRRTDQDDAVMSLRQIREHYGLAPTDEG